MSRTVFVIGAGAWGTALAQAAIAAGNGVTLIARDPALVDEINTRHTHSKALPGIPLDPALAAQTGLDGLADADCVLLAVPAQASRAVLSSLPSGILADKPVILCAKGFEATTTLRQSEILAALAPGALPFVLSGPSFAHDVASGRPTAVTLAGPDITAAEEVALWLAGPALRPYSSDDVTGVELAGGLKNVYALGAGAIEGAGLGLSARSAYLARAFAEMGRMIVALGGDSATLGGLAGIGDLALSCTSDASRNYRFGLELGRGRTVGAILDQGLGLAEGVATAPVARAMARAADVDAPLIDAVNSILEGDVPLADILAGLMARPLKREGQD